MTQRINLYNRALLPRPDWLLLEYVIGYATIAALLALGIGLMASSAARKAERALADSQQQLEQAQQQLVALASAPKRQIDGQLQQQRQAALDEQLQLQQILNLGSTTPHAAALRYSSVLSAFASHTPRGIWLTAIDVNGNGTMAEGFALTPGLVATLAQALSNDPALNGKHFAGLDLQSQPISPPEPLTPAANATGPTPATGATSTQQPPAAGIGPSAPISLPAYRFRLGSTEVKS